MMKNSCVASVLFALVSALACSGCATGPSMSSEERRRRAAARERERQQLYADIQKEMEASAIRRQMDNDVRKDEDALKMRGINDGLPEFR